MSNSYDKYAEKLGNIMTLDEVDRASKMAGRDPHMDGDQRIQLSPETDVEFRAELTKPYTGDDMVNKNLRTANLERMEYMVIKRASIFQTWLDSFSKDHDLKQDKNIVALKSEIFKDIGIILNMSVSKKGWLLDNILNPKKRFSFFADKSEKRGILGRTREDQR